MGISVVINTSGTSRWIDIQRISVNKRPDNDVAITDDTDSISNVVPEQLVIKTK
jgi:hypothetical protein